MQHSKLAGAIALLDLALVWAPVWALLRRSLGCGTCGTIDTPTP